MDNDKHKLQKFVKECPRYPNCCYLFSSLMYKNIPYVGYYCIKRLSTSGLTDKYFGYRENFHKKRYKCEFNGY